MLLIINSIILVESVGFEIIISFRLGMKIIKINKIDEYNFKIKSIKYKIRKGSKVK